MKINAKQLFLVDAVGAILSAFLLGVVLVKLEHFFGIPLAVLYLLAAFPCFFACYDLLCYFLAKKRATFFLKGIAYANIAYCILSIGIAFFHLESITYLGWTYILGEVLIVGLLVRLEIKVAKG
ncbi:MAG: hypothetical protein AAGG68_18415 [Bacteroidota bacterium]